jgi:hypothetical protein
MPANKQASKQASKQFSAATFDTIAFTQACPSPSAATESTLSVAATKATAAAAPSFSLLSIIDFVAAVGFDSNDSGPWVVEVCTLQLTLIYSAKYLTLDH